ncbi:hypothetical protein K9M47_03835 [Candidatus Gracilibacteria bacterium]|nr:hypothetical protein [Candidatus Gracilibacteria bacterium]MCF7898458.1 hypothetical protein [Candidatus Paceibacterota bacterium]
MIKKLIVAIFALTLIAFSIYILNRGIINPNTEDVINQSDCTSDEYLDNNECKPITKTCPDGKVINKIDVCDIEVSTSSSTSTNNTPLPPLKKTTTGSSSSENEIDKTLPLINKVTVSGGGKTMTVSISGVNFDKKVNTITLVTGTGRIEKLTLPAYPMPDKTLQINFKITDFRTNEGQAYTFQVLANGKLSNIYSVGE